MIHLYFHNNQIKYEKLNDNNFFFIRFVLAFILNIIKPNFPYEIYY